MARDIYFLHAGSRSRSVPDISSLKARKRSNCFYQSLYCSEPSYSLRIAKKCSSHSFQTLHQLRWRLRKYLPQTLLQDDILPHPNQILHDHIEGVRHFHKFPHKIPISNPLDRIPTEQENVFILLDEDSLPKCEVDSGVHTNSEVSQQDTTDLNSKTFRDLEKTAYNQS